MPLTVELFPDLSVTLEASAFDAAFGAGAATWSGTIKDRRHGFATLVRRGTGVVGHVQIGEQTFRITPLSNGEHVIEQELAPEISKDDIAIEAPGSLHPGSLDAAPPTRASQAAAARIRILVIFTNRARDQATAAGRNIVDEARLAVAMANTTYANTRLPGRLQIAGIRGAGCGYDEDATSYSDTLDDFTSASTCIGARAAQLRNDLGADLVAVLRGNGSHCGIAWVNSSPAGQSAYGFSVTSRGCISNHTFAHEVGHNMGLNHDRYVSSGPQTNSNFGYVAIADRVRSIMAYNNRCSDQGFNCARVQVFSNTIKAAYWNGTIKMGRSLRQTDPADNRSKLSANWNTIAGWR